MDRDKVNGITLAKHMGVSSATISDWTHGNKLPRLDKIKTLSDYFHVSMDDLTGDPDEHKSPPEILIWYNDLNEENRGRLLERAKELHMLQSMQNDIHIARPC